jgi:hypothetical protein
MEAAGVAAADTMSTQELLRAGMWMFRSSVSTKRPLLDASPGSVPPPCTKQQHAAVAAVWAVAAPKADRWAAALLARRFTSC